ncbi:MAG TPA: hypothetical protein VIY86_07805, partial [Pirellulaceae bacterium]
MLSPYFSVWTIHWTVDVFLVLALFLNSPMGRYTDEWLTDAVIRVWEELRVRVWGVAFQWVMDVFHRLLTGLDRILFTLDEWSRFRARDNRGLKAFKLATGALWSIVSYFIVFVSTLLIEPQINPIKHFPVVTVSHKFILPTGPILVRRLSPYIGKARANTLVWSTIWLIPGVFGFLVWELRENWRLYAANRPQVLRPQPIGGHGETMQGLLRPTFHSGTLPKTYARLRRALHKTWRIGDRKPLHRQQAALRLLRRSIQRFGEREFVGLLREGHLADAATIEVRDVSLATCRVEFIVERASCPPDNLRITWEVLDDRLVGNIQDHGLIEHSSESARHSLEAALSGLFQRTGV